MRLALTFALLTTPAFADVTVTFIESAPKDRFVITNIGCPLNDATLDIDLSTAPAGVIFDVTAAGAGVEVFQPVEVITGDVTASAVKDGDQILTLQMAAFATDAQVIISADLDDLQTNGALGQIRVSGSEIALATVRLTSPDQSDAATFDQTATARITVAEQGSDCAST